MDTPQPLLMPDFAKLVKACQDYIDFVASDEYQADRMGDYENDIFEKAMEAVYGKNVWKWINKRMV